MSGIVGRSASNFGTIKDGTGLEYVGKWPWSSGNNILANYCFTDKFDTYLFKIFARPTTNAHAINIRLNDGGTDSEASAYWATNVGRDWDGAAYTTGSVSSAYMPLTPNSNNNATYSLDAVIWVHNARSTTKNTQMNGTISWLHGSGMSVGSMWAGGHTTTATQWDGLRIYASSDFHTGDAITVWGLKTFPHPPV